MKTESRGSFRVYPYSDNGFFDIFPLKCDYGVEMICFDSFSYHVVISQTYGIKILVFEHKGYFEDWLEEMGISKEELNIIYEGGKQ